MCKTRKCHYNIYTSAFHFVSPQMAYLHYLLFVFLCMASVAMAARGKQFPSCNRGCWSKIMKCNLFSRCLCDHADRQDPGNCRCCNNCKSCLGNMWNYCCGCLKMCPPPDPTVPSDVYMSTAGDLKEFIPSLFEALSYGSNLPFKFANHRPSRKTHVGANGESTCFPLYHV